MFACNNKISFTIKVISLLLLTAAFFPSNAGKIRGIVRSAYTHSVIAKVSISIEGTNSTAITDSLGSFTIDSIAPGSYNLLFYNEKFEPLSLNDVFVSGNEEKVLEIELNPPVQKLEKIVVKGNAFRKAPEMSTSTKTMNFDEILRSPGALVDVQRVVQDLPSVSSGGDNTNEIIVRGGNPGENLLLMDNIEIPNPNHFANQGSGGGVISLINPLLVKGLVFCAGAPPAMYGGKASSVLDVKLRDGNDKAVIGGVDLGMAGVGVHAEGPIWPGSTFMLSATKSFLNLFAHYANTTAIPEFWGLQAKLVQTIGKHKLYGNFLYGDNSITINDAQNEAGTNGDIIKAGGTTYASGLNLESKWSDRFSTTLTISGVGNSFDRSEYSDLLIDNSAIRDSFFFNNSIEQEQTIKLQSELSLEQAKIEAGLQVKRCDFRIDIWERPDTVFQNGIQSIYQKSAQSSDIAYKYGGYINGIVYPLQNLRIIPGVRVDGFTFNNSLTVSPRLGTVYSLSSNLDLTAAIALQYQDPDYAYLVSTPANKELKPKKVFTGIGGLEYSLKPLSAKFSLEGYYKKYDQMPVESSLLTPDQFDQSDTMLSIGQGKSYGVEAFFQKKLTKHFSGSLAYSLSRSFNKDPRPGHGGQWYRSDYDFRNALTVSGGYKVDLIESAWYKRIHSAWWVIALSPILPIADRVEISAKWRYLGGRPYTDLDTVNHHWIAKQDALNTSQYPDYHRLDIRIERRYGFGFLQMIYYFDLQNIYDKKNIWMYLYSNTQQKKTPIYQFSFFPAGGLIIGF